MSYDVVFLNDITLRADYRVNRYIGPYVLASALEDAGFSTQVIDWFTEIENFFEYLTPFLGATTRVVAISSTFLTQPFDTTGKIQGKALRTDQARNYFSGCLWKSSDEEMAQWLDELRALMRRRCPEAKLVMGGAKVMHAIRSMREGEVWVRRFDALFVGASDETMIDYVRAPHGSSPDPTFVKGGSLNASICPTMRWQKSWSILPGEALPIEISRGCLFNCRFCHYEKRASQLKSVDDIRTEMLRNFELFGTTGYHFCDDCFNDRRSKVEAICNMILSLPFKIDWISYARIDLASRHPETMDLMVESGCRGVWLGLESFNAEAARSAGKGVHPDKVKEALLGFRAKHREKCMFAASFITGLPGETEESQLDTLNWILENDVLEFASFGVLGLLPYDSSLDKEAMDYAEYTRHPEKYGFKKVSWEPYYWEHDTMNSKSAAVLAEHCQNQWLKKKGQVFFKFLWAYPSLRGYGFSHEEIMSMARDPELAEFWRAQVRERKKARDEMYWERLRQQAKPSRSYANLSISVPPT